MGASGAGKAMEPSMKTETDKARRGRRADAGNSDGMELMNAAAKTAVKSAGNAGGQGRAARVGSRRRMNTAGAKLTKTWTTSKGRCAAGAPSGGQPSATRA